MQQTLKNFCVISGGIFCALIISVSAQARPSSTTILQPQTDSAFTVDSTGKEFACEGVTESGSPFKALFKIDIFGGDISDKIFLKVGDWENALFSQHNLIYRLGKDPAYLHTVDGGTVRVELLDQNHIAFEIRVADQSRLVKEDVKKANCKISTPELYEKPILTLDAQDPVASFEEFLAQSQDDLRVIEDIVEIVKYMEEEQLPRETALYSHLISDIQKFPDLSNDGARYYYLLVIDCMIASHIPDMDKWVLMTPFLESKVSNNPQVYLQTVIDAIAYGLFPEKGSEYLQESMDRVLVIKDTISANYGQMQPPGADGNLVSKCDLVCQSLQFALMKALNSNDVASFPNRTAFIRFYFDQLVNEGNRKTFVDELQLRQELSDRDVILAEVAKYKSAHP